MAVGFGCSVDPVSCPVKHAALSKLLLLTHPGLGADASSPAELRPGMSAQERWEAVRATCSANGWLQDHSQVHAAAARVLWCPVHAANCLVLPCAQSSDTQVLHSPHRTQPPACETCSLTLTSCTACQSHAGLRAGQKSTLS